MVMLVDSNTGKEIKLPKVHGNKKIRNPITGQKSRTMGQLRKAARESAERLTKAFQSEHGVI